VLAGWSLVTILCVTFLHHQAGLNFKCLPSLLVSNLVDVGLFVLGLWITESYDYNCVIYLPTHLTCSLTGHYMYSAS